MKLNHQLPPYTKINSRWIKDLNISQDTIKVLEENKGRKISDVLCSNIFTDMFSRARDIKERINKWDLIKFKISVWLKKTHSTKLVGEVETGSWVREYVEAWWTGAGKVVVDGQDTPHLCADKL